MGCYKIMGSFILLICNYKFKYLKIASMIWRLDNSFHFIRLERISFLIQTNGNLRFIVLIGNGVWLRLEFHQTLTLRVANESDNPAITLPIL
jgi:hypothetical protein